MKNVTKFLLTFALCIMSFPFSLHVKADEYTYREMQMSCNILAYDSTYEAYYFQISSPSVMPRAFIYHNTTNQTYGAYVVTLENVRKINNAKAASGACAAYSGNGTQFSLGYDYNGTPFGYVSLNVSYATTYNLPIVEGSSAITSDLVYRYTFGDLAVGDATVTTDYGDIILKGYKTDIAGSGNAAVNNKDIITWEPVDTNGNDITNCQVTIRAVPGQYSAESKASLLEKIYTDFVTDVLNATNLGTYPVREESHSYTWGSVIDVLDLPFLSISSLLQRDNTWIKNGWIYQIRLEDSEQGYVGDWQTVYTATAAGVENDLTVINSTTLNQDLINVITSINNRNEVTNNWTIINIIIVPNPDPTPTPEPGTDPGGNSDWLSALLQAIVDLISGILSFLAGIVQLIIDGILGLFSFDDFELDDILNLFNDEVNQQNLIGQTYFFWDEVIETAQSMRNQDPIINWPGITIMSVDLIPAATYNLNDYVSQLGLTDLHNLVYIVTDGSIAICLLWLIHKKIMAVLHL